MPSGAVDAFASALCRVLRLDEKNYAQLSHRNVETAGGYRWSRIARDTIRKYREALSRLQRTAR